MAINIIKKNPTAGEVTSSLTSESGGLHFDGASSHISLANSAAAKFGTSDFSLEFILNQTKESTDETYYFTAPYTGDNRMGLWYDKANTTLKIYFRATGNTHYAFGYDMANDFGTPTHFVVTADRDGNATLYKNGNSVGSVDISGSSAVNIGDGNANPSYISANAASTAIIGTLSRFRTFNKLVDAQKLFERSDIEFSEQYGSQTQIVGSDFSSATQNFNGNGGATAANIDSIGGQNDVLRFTIDSANANHQVMKSVDNTTGKKYRIQGKVYIPAANSLIDGVQINENGSAGVAVIATINATDTWTSFDVEHIWTGYDEIRFRALDGTATVFTGNGSDVFYLRDITVNAIGAVSDYCLSEASPTASLMLADRSTNGVDGTISSSGVTAISKPIQISAVAARIGTTAATPADGNLEVSGNVGVGGSPQSPVGVSRYLYVGSASEAGIVLDDTASEPWEIFTDAGNLKFNYNDTGNALTINTVGNVALEGSNDVKLTLSDQGTPHTNDSNFVRGRGATGLQFNSAVGGYAFEIAGSEKVSISSAGQVSIGAGAGQLLNVYQVGDSGNDYFEGAVKIGGASATLGGFIGYNSASSGSVNITNLNPSGGANSKINIGFGAAIDGTPATNAMTLDQTGIVSIGQASTANFGLLQVYGTGDNTNEQNAAFTIGDNATGGMRFYGGVNNTNNYAYIGSVESGTSYRRLVLQPNGSTVQIGSTEVQGNAFLSIRRNGDAINFGHGNGAGYGSVIGASVNNGNPHIGLCCEAGTNDNTFKTRGLKGTVIYSNTSGELKISQITNANADNQAPTDRVTINSAGLATFSAGISFSQTNSSATGASATSTTLNHYEVGSWTPVLKKGSTEHTGVTVYGKYTRVGNLVWISFYIYKASGGTESAAGAWNVSGLPFTITEDSSAGYQSIPSGYFQMNGVDYISASPHRWQANDTTAITMYGTNRSTNWASGAIEFQGTGVLQVN